MERSVSASKWTLGGWVGKWGLGMELDFQPHFWSYCRISCTQDVTSSLPWHDGELCFLQNGTCLLEATVPHSAIEFICNMTGRQHSQTCLEPSDFGWLSQGIFPRCMQPPLWSGKKKQPSLSPRQIFICWPIKQRVTSGFYCFTHCFSYWARKHKILPHRSKLTDETIWKTL